jgi:hypothetical protein
MTKNDSFILPESGITVSAETVNEVADWLVLHSMESEYLDTEELIDSLSDEAFSLGGLEWWHGRNDADIHAIVGEAEQRAKPFFDALYSQYVMLRKIYLGLSD